MSCNCKDENCNCKKDNVCTCTDCKCDEGTATLVVRREKRILGFAITFPVFVDDVKLGSLKNNDSLTCNLTPGEHIIKIKSLEKTIEQKVTVTKKTKSVELIVALRMGLLAGRAVLKEVKID